MKLNKQILVMGLIVVSSTTQSFGQKTKYNSRCEALRAFLNSQEVSGWFGRNNPKDSDVVIVDVQNNLNQCTFSEWRGFGVSIVSKGPLRDSLAKFNPYYVLRGRLKYYVLLSNEQNGVIDFFIRQGSSSYACEVKIFKRKNKFILGKIKNDTL